MNECAKLLKYLDNLQGYASLLQEPPRALNARIQEVSNMIVGLKTCTETQATSLVEQINGMDFWTADKLQLQQKLDSKVSSSMNCRQGRDQQEFESVLENFTAKDWHAIQT